MAANKAGLAQTQRPVPPAAGSVTAASRRPGRLQSRRRQATATGPARVRAYAGGGAGTAETVRTKASGIQQDRVRFASQAVRRRSCSTAPPTLPCVESKSIMHAIRCMPESHYEAPQISTSNCCAS
eukprot:203940-Chlamydomonas_euryale.AAC.2